MKYRCIIFDLDGTLADTIADIASAANRALVFNDFPPLPVNVYTGLVGWGIKALALNALAQVQQKEVSAIPEETAQKVADDTMRFYAEEPLVQTKPYPGITELLSKLAQKKVSLAILSNKPDPLAQTVADGLFPRQPFTLVRGEIPGIERKPDPTAVWELLAELDKTPSDTIFAGDSEIDMKCARAAGCFPLGVSWGFRDRSTLEEAGAAVIIDRPMELFEKFF